MIIKDKILARLDGLPKDVSDDIEKMIKAELPKCKNINEFNELRGKIIAKHGFDIKARENKKINTDNTKKEEKHETVEIIDPKEEINSLEKLEKKLKPLFPDIWDETLACLSVYATLALKSPNGCVSLILVGAPSSQKTTALSLFYGFRLSRVEDNFSPRGFVSHASNFSEQELREKIDLLPRIKNKCLLSPELAPIFECNKDRLVDNFSILTRVLDGEGLTTHTGAKGTRGYSGDYFFIWLGATTPLRHSVWKLMGKLGNRLFFWQLSAKTKTNDEFVSMFLDYETEYSERIKIARGYINSFLESFFEEHPIRSVEWNRKADIHVFEVIVKYAKLLTKLRGSLMIWKNSDQDKYNYSIPIIEEPPRAISQLYNFARGRALLESRNYLTEKDLEIVKRIALSSMPHDRRKVLNILLKHDGRASTSVIEKELNTSKDTALRTMNVFTILGIVDEKELILNTEFGGRPEKFIELKEEFKELLLSDRCINNEINSLIAENKPLPEKNNEKNISLDLIKKALGEEFTYSDLVNYYKGNEEATIKIRDFMLNQGIVCEFKPRKYKWNEN